MKFPYSFLTGQKINGPQRNGKVSQKKQKESASSIRPSSTQETQSNETRDSTSSPTATAPPDAEDVNEITEDFSNEVGLERNELMEVDDNYDSDAEHEKKKTEVLRKLSPEVTKAAMALKESVLFVQGKTVSKYTKSSN
jgi:dGTP triphosphohydrolase